MSKIIQIGITKLNNKDIESINSAKLTVGKGIEGDRFCLENNDEKSQVSLIQSENIDYYNSKFNTNFSYIEFRRNLITKDIELNDLVGKKLKINFEILSYKETIKPVTNIAPAIKLKKTALSYFSFFSSALTLFKRILISTFFFIFDFKFSLSFVESV